MDNKVSNILDLFPNLTISTIEKVLKNNDYNVENSIDYLLNHKVDDTVVNGNSSNLDNCGKGFGSNDNSGGSNQLYEFKSKEDEENERLFKEFIKNEEMENERLNKSKVHHCEICFMDLPIEDFYILDECEHRFCTDCLKTHFTIQIKSGYPNLKCPSTKCRYIASYDEAKHLLSDEVFQRYDRLLLNAHLQKDKNVFTCPNGDCGMKMVGSKSNPQYVECLNEECGLQFCTDCREEAHQELSCEDLANLKREMAEYLEDMKCSEELRRELQTQNQYGRYSRKVRGKINKRIFFMGKRIKDETSFKTMMKNIQRTNRNSYNWMLNNTMVCPHCFSLVEKSIGCNDLKCYCGKHFCFGCGEKRESHNQRYPCPRQLTGQLETVLQKKR